LKVLLPVYQVFEVRLSELKKVQELIEFLILSAVSFLLPMLLGGPQLLVGIVVNLLIVRQALTQKGWKASPTIILPSLGAVSRGILFGSLTRYLIIIVPFIWLGNFAISYFSKLMAHKAKPLRIIIPSLVKSIVIFSPVLLLVQLSVLPSAFIVSMGAIQFITALLGSLLATLITEFEHRNLILKSRSNVRH